MNKTLITLALVIFSSGNLNAKDNFYGKWLIKEKVTTAIGVSTLSEDDVHSFLGKAIEYSADSAKFDTEICSHPKYKKRILSQNDFLTSEKVSLLKLDIKAKNIIIVEVLDNNDNLCLKAGGIFYIKNKKSLITNINGVYFKLDRF